jgi:hypothetical protein
MITLTARRVHGADGYFGAPEAAVRGSNSNCSVQPEGALIRRHLLALDEDTYGFRLVRQVRRLHRLGRRASNGADAIGLQEARHA